MNSSSHTPVCSWTVELRGTLLVDEQRGALACVPYPAAAVWDFMVRGLSLEKMSTLLRPIGHFADVEAARGYAAGCLAAWTEQGFVKPSDVEVHG